MYSNGFNPAPYPLFSHVQSCTSHGGLCRDVGTSLLERRSWSSQMAGGRITCRGRRASLMKFKSSSGVMRRFRLRSPTVDLGFLTLGFRASPGSVELSACRNPSDRARRLRSSPSQVVVSASGASENGEICSGRMQHRSLPRRASCGMGLTSDLWCVSRDKDRRNFLRVAGRGSSGARPLVWAPLFLVRSVPQLFRVDVTSKSADAGSPTTTTPPQFG